MNEKSFPTIAGFVALLLVLLFVIFAGSNKTQINTSAPSAVSRSAQMSGTPTSNSAIQRVELPFPVQSTVTIDQ